MGYIDETDEEKAKISTHYLGLYSGFSEAESKLKYNDLLECQVLEAECKAIKDAKATYEHIYNHLSKVLSILKNSNNKLSNTGSSLKKHLENAKDLEKITKDIRTLVQNQNDDRSKLQSICNELKTALDNMRTDYNTRNEKYTTLRAELSNNASACKKWYDRAYYYYYAKGLEYSMNFSLPYYNETTLNVFNYLGITF